MSSELELLYTEARAGGSLAAESSDSRCAHQRDHDRLLFSTPVRRLADKTQVFPQDSNDSVRTRLTHSHEVANIACSISSRIFSDSQRSTLDPFYELKTRAILGAIGLAHDLGNPPFGHAGERSIGNWFRENQEVFVDEANDISIPEPRRDEFLKFEGNAQTIRIVTKLQTSAGYNGLDLTFATLSALMKYPVDCASTNAGSAASKKYGFFESERQIVDRVMRDVGLIYGQRHPLTWIMEVSDDIAYCTLDVEDAIKKKIFSPDDVYYIFNDSNNEDVKNIAVRLKILFSKIDKSKRSNNEIRDIKASYLRTCVIGSLIERAVEDFQRKWDGIKKFENDKSLLDGDPVLETMRKVSKEYVFSSQEVCRLEAKGEIAIQGIMDFLWFSISDRKDAKDLSSRRNGSVSSYGWSIISDNYKQVALNSTLYGECPDNCHLRYRELRLLTDMVAGMTDGFAMSLYDKIRSDDFMSKLRVGS